MLLFYVLFDYSFFLVFISILQLFPASYLLQDFFRSYFSSCSSQVSFSCFVWLFFFYVLIYPTTLSFFLSFPAILNHIFLPVFLSIWQLCLSLNLVFLPGVIIVLFHVLIEYLHKYVCIFSISYPKKLRTFRFWRSYVWKINSGTKISLLRLLASVLNIFEDFFDCTHNFSFKKSSYFKRMLFFKPRKCFSRLYPNWVILATRQLYYPRRLTRINI